MGEKVKASRYNHFVEVEEGKRLAFNAMTCGLAEMDKASYDGYAAIAERGEVVDSDASELVKNLRLGGILIPEELDELALIRASHYQERFSRKNLGLTIVPTYSCNFACDYCFESRDMHALPNHSGGMMSSTVQDNIVRLCEREVATDATFVVVWYGGEPFLAKEVINSLSPRFLEICRAKNSSYYGAMITNGYFLTPTNVGFLEENRVRFVQITLDGPRDVHDRRRPLKGGGATFDTILDNLCYIGSKGTPAVSVRINIDRRNASRATDLLTVLKDRGLHTRPNIGVYFSQTVHYANSCPDIFSKCMLTEEFSGWMVDAYRAAMSMGFRISMYPVPQLGSCGAVGKGIATIEPNGNVQTCWNAVGDESKKVGVLTQNGIEYSFQYAKWLGHNSFREECLSCDVMPICMGGCPYKSIHAEALTDAEHNRCVWWVHNLRPMLLVIKEAKDRGLLEIRPQGGESSGNRTMVSEAVARTEA